MTLSHIRNRNRVGYRYLFVTILLSSAITLSLSLITPSVAQAECDGTGRVANGGTKWYYPGLGGPPVSGYGQFHMKECKNGQPAKGRLFNVTTEIGGEAVDEWDLVSLSVEGGAMKIVNSADFELTEDDGWWTVDVDGNRVDIHGDVAWVLGQIIDSSDELRIGKWLLGAALDGGTPGKNGDVLFIWPIQYDTIDEVIDLYELVISTGSQPFPFWAPLVKGNVQIN
jgi:hypothetical protein